MSRYIWILLFCNHHVFKVCTNDPESGFCKASDQQCIDCKGNDDCEKKLKKICSRCRSNRCPWYGKSSVNMIETNWV